MQVVESIQVIQSRVICGGSDLIADTQEISQIWIMRCRSFQAIEESFNYEKWLKVNIRLMMLSAPKNMLQMSVRS